MRISALAFGVVLVFAASLTAPVVGQNTWAHARVENRWGKPITDVTLSHRYDRDYYHSQTWDAIDDGAKSPSLKVGYNTGFGRTGKDYWQVSFEVDGKRWTCKDDFYCFLTKDDADGTVVCRITKTNMAVDCPKSSDCDVALTSAVAKPNSWAKVVVRNDWGASIRNVTLRHRYDTDHYDAQTWGEIASGATSPSLAVGFWTGAFRTGKDYWQITFEAKGRVWTCKDNFYCFLTKDDVGGEVTLRVADRKMFVDCPKSSDCEVGLDSAVAQPNTWAQARVENAWGKTIRNVVLRHRYDDDHFDTQSWPELASGAASSSFKVGYWTGAFRTGKDYWSVSFEVDGKVWTCKDNFYCFLTKDDADGTVTCKVGGEKMAVDCPKSSDCQVGLSSTELVAHGRPVYVIGHRCNDPEDVALAVYKGCNAIECDLQYDDASKEIFVHHDRPAGATLAQWLDVVRRVAGQNPEQFALLVFDTKFAAGRDPRASSAILLRVRELARRMLPADLNVVYGVADYPFREALDGVTGGMLPNEGVAIDQDDDPGQVQAWFNQRKVTSFWYGDGIFVAGTKDVYEHIAEACALRDSGAGIKKVYVWTLAKKDSIRRYFENARVDAVMVNVPGTMDEVATSYGLAEALEVLADTRLGLRLARRSDPAFVRSK